MFSANFKSFGSARASARVEVVAGTFEVVLIDGHDEPGRWDRTEQLIYENQLIVLRWGEWEGLFRELYILNEGWKYVYKKCRNRDGNYVRYWVAYDPEGRCICDNPAIPDSILLLKKEHWPADWSR